MFRERVFVATLVGFASIGCNKDDGAPSKSSGPAPSASVGATCTDSGQIGDTLTASFFPSSIADYCLDPSADTSYGEGSKHPLDDICAKEFGADCAAFKELGLRRVIEVRYVGGAGRPPVVVYLSQFPSGENAYAMFTKRVVADRDPVQGGLSKLNGGVAGAIGGGRAYVWKGFYFAQARYPDGQVGPADQDALGQSPVAAIATEVGRRLHGGVRLPAAAAKLPTDHRSSTGILYTSKNAEAVDGTGPGATGFYQDGDKRYRVVSIFRDDDAQATDALKAFGKQRGAAPVKEVGDGGYRVLLNGGQGNKIEWLVARSGKWVVGVGDEEFALKPTMAPADHERVCLSRAEKSRYLKELLQ